MTRALALWVLVGTACYVPFGEVGRPCPCGEGWRCCADENVCVRADDVCRPPFAPNPSLTALSEGSALDLGPFRCEPPPGEPAGQCRNVIDGATVRYDRRHHRFVMLGGGATQVDVLFVFDPNTLTWQAAYQPTVCDLRTAENFDAMNAAWKSGPGPSWPRPVMNVPQDSFVPAPAIGQLVLFRRNGILTLTCRTRVDDFSGTVAHFDVASGAWSFSSELGDNPSDLQAFEWDSRSQRIVSLGQGGLSLYDPRARTWRRLVSGFELPGPLSYNQELVYEPKVDRFFYFQDSTQKVYGLTLDRERPFMSSVVEVPTSGRFPSGSRGYVFAEGAGVVVGAPQRGVATLFDASTASFRQVPIGDGGVGTGQSHAIAYDPVNDVILFLTDSTSGFHTWLWKLPR